MLSFLEIYICCGACINCFVNHTILRINFMDKLEFVKSNTSTKVSCVNFRGKLLNQKDILVERNEYSILLPPIIW